MTDISCKPWTKKKPPRRILAIRLQAMGDVVITLPYLQYLRNALPAETQLDFLTREETEDIPKNIDLFDNVYSIGGERNFKKQLLSTFLLLPRLFLRRYDIIVDLQNSILSRLVWRILRPSAWSAFDRFSPSPAGERNRRTIEAVGLGDNPMDTRLRVQKPILAKSILESMELNGTEKLVVLNPAGAFVTRNWEMQKYVLFARQWMILWPNTRFIVLGTSLIANKAAFLAQELGSHLTNLVGRTTPLEVFSLMRHMTLVVSEDSGLMHMAWVSGTPVVALFGSTRSDWSRPLGPHSVVLDSSDLACGNCMQETCRRGDVICLTRRSPEEVLARAVSLLEKLDD